MTAVAANDMTQDIDAIMDDLGRRAKKAARALSIATEDQKNTALRQAAAALRASVPALLEANEKDITFGKEKNLSDAMIDRLVLNEDRIEGVAKALEDIADLPDPVGTVINEWDRPNGLHISRNRVPIGVLGIIYESRPNVTADAGALCLKAGNAAILRGGSESFHSSRVIHEALLTGLRAAGLPDDSIQLVPTRDRAAVGKLLTMVNTVDVIIPRGGASLVERIMREARVPVLAHLEGLVHIYVDKAADLAKTTDIIVNAKMRRTGICGAAETILVDRDVADSVMAPVVTALLDAGCAVRGDDTAQGVDARVEPAVDEDWRTEYLDAIISVKTVDGVDGAIDHIAEYSSAHTDCIITEDQTAAKAFTHAVDSAIVMVNASTQFADGGEFGMGAEIGISTNRLHARGPVGAEQLTTFKYVVQGNGQIRG